MEDLVLNCKICLKYSISKCKQEPSLFLGQEVPLHPWTKLATYVFHLEGASYLLTVDNTSRFPVVHKLTSMTGQHIASHFKLICSEYGWLETLVSDTGPCYTSEVFTNLMREYNINHSTSSPYYLQSSGLAEKYIQSVKNMFYRAKQEGKDLFNCLMVYCNTPLSSTLCSPIQILARRAARSSLPMSNAARKQQGLDCEDLRTKYQNGHLPSHDIFESSSYVSRTSYQKMASSNYKLCQEPRSYIITTKEGVQYRKTQAHLKSYHPQDRTSKNKLLAKNNQ